MILKLWVGSLTVYCSRSVRCMINCLVNGYLDSGKYNLEAQAVNTASQGQTNITSAGRQSIEACDLGYVPYLTNIPILQYTNIIIIIHIKSTCYIADTL